MIIESLQLANNTMLASVQATNNKQAAKNFKEQVIALSQYTAQLEPLLNIIKAMRSKGIGDKAFTGEIKIFLQNAVDTCGQKTDDHTLDASTVAALKSSVELCRNNAENAWKEVAEQMAGGVENSLSSLKSLLSDKKEAEDLLDALGKAKVSIPNSSKAIDAFMDNVTKGKALVDGLHLDEETEKFIVKVRAQQATVRDLTPHIMDWMRQNNLMEQIKVRF